MNAAAQKFGEAFETFVSAGAFDAKGREIGFIVGFNDDGANDFRAWVQAARRVGGLSGDFSDHGVRQRSKGFSSAEEANRWAYATARERIAKVAA